MEFINKEPIIYVVSGKARSGKNSVCEIIKNHYNDLKVINLAYADTLKDYVMKITSWDGSEETKPRELLQNLGVELIKTHIDDSMLVRRMVEDIKVYSYFYDVITISDARFPNEIDIIKDNFSNVISIRVLRDEKNDLTEKQNKHATEIAMNDYSNYDYVINNNDTLENLEKEVRKCIK